MLAIVKSRVYGAFVCMFAAERANGLTFGDTRWDSDCWVFQDIYTNKVQYNLFGPSREDADDWFCFGLNLEFKQAWETLERASIPQIQAELNRLPQDYEFAAVWRPRPSRRQYVSQPIGTQGQGLASTLNITQLLADKASGANRPFARHYRARWRPQFKIYTHLCRVGGDILIDEYLDQMRDIRRHLSTIEGLC